MNARFGTDALTAELLDSLANDESAATEISQLLGSIEHFSVGVNTEVFDYDIASRMSGTYLINLFHRLRPFIEHRQLSSPTVFVDYEQLVNRLEDARRGPVPVQGKIARS